MSEMLVALILCAVAILGAVAYANFPKIHTPELDTDLDREVRIALWLQHQRGTPEGEEAWRLFRDAGLRKRGIAAGG